MKSELLHSTPRRFKVKTPHANKSIALQTVAIDAGLKWRDAGAVVANADAAGITFATSKQDMYMICDSTLQNFNADDVHELDHNTALLFFLEMIAQNADNEADPLKTFEQELVARNNLRHPGYVIEDTNKDLELITLALITLIHSMQINKDQVEQLRAEVLG